MNPALLARAFLFFAFPAYMSGDIWTDLSAESGHALIDAYSGATNLVTFDANYTKLPSAADMFWGDRYGRIEDPFGHQWSIATHVRDVSPEEIRQAALVGCKE